MYSFNYFIADRFKRNSRMSSLLCGTSGNAEKYYAGTSDEDCMPFTDNNSSPRVPRLSVKDHTILSLQMLSKGVQRLFFTN